MENETMIGVSRLVPRPSLDLDYYQGERRTCKDDICMTLHGHEKT
jgi:hypothetical protein